MPELNKKSASIADSSHPTPIWLTSEYLQDKLRKFYKDSSLNVVNLEIQPATGKGENYASVMTRVKIQFKGICNNGIRDVQTQSYIVKTSFESDEFLSSIMRPYDMYRCEMEMYEKILPQLSELLKEVTGSGKHEKLFADTIHVDYSNSAIIFEDLSAAKNYMMADRLIGLDIDHTKLALHQLAKMHATSAVLNERSPGIFKKFDRGIFNRHTQSWAPYFTGVLDACARYMERSDDFSNEYSKKLYDLKRTVMEHATRVFDPLEDNFNTLVHGDFWVNNMMFKYDQKSKVPTDVVLVDFQFSCWASPAVDLHYFFNTSLREELRYHWQDELFQWYYYELVDTLKQLKFTGNIPSLHKFRIQMEAKSFYAVTSSCIVQPVMINENLEDADFHALMKDDERSKNFKRRLFENAKVQNNLKRLLPIFDRKGLLDMCD